MSESDVGLLYQWAMFAGIGALLTWGNPDNFDNRWGKVFGYSFLLTCVLKAVGTF